MSSVHGEDTRALQAATRVPKRAPRPEERSRARREAASSRREPRERRGRRATRKRAPRQVCGRARPEESRASGGMRASASRRGARGEVLRAAHRLFDARPRGVSESRPRMSDHPPIPEQFDALLERMRTLGEREAAEVRRGGPGMGIHRRFAVERWARLTQAGIDDSEKIPIAKGVRRRPKGERARRRARLRGEGVCDADGPAVQPPDRRAEVGDAPGAPAIRCRRKTLAGGWRATVESGDVTAAFVVGGPGQANPQSRRCFARCIARGGFATVRRVTPSAKRRQASTTSNEARGSASRRTCTCPSPSTRHTASARACSAKRNPCSTCLRRTRVRWGVGAAPDALREPHCCSCSTGGRGASVGGAVHLARFHGFAALEGATAPWW